MKVHVLQHVPFEDIGSMASWLRKVNAEVYYTRFFDKPILPQLDKLDLIIVMGGPMSVHDDSDFPWLRLEKQFIRDAITQDISVLGVCLGAQLIASALGQRIYKNPFKEIGWYPIESTASSPDWFQFPSLSSVFHWHGETFDLPSGATRLAKSAACENQAFQIKHNVIGMQFHLEATQESIRALIDHCDDELVPGPYVQTQSQLFLASESTYKEINALMDKVLSYLTSSVAQI
jgi:GMP synthase-like glutamine amidotransferase